MTRTPPLPVAPDLGREHAHTLDRLRSADEVGALHEDIRRRFPGGLSYEQFKIETLKTADEEGRVYPPPLAGMGTFTWITRMSLNDKLLDYRGTYKTPYVPNHFINAAGRAAIAKAIGTAP